jgi:hypothetical protein
MRVVQMNARCGGCDLRMGWEAHAGGNPNDRVRSAEHAVAADRFAREIVRFLTASLARSRQLNGIPFGVRGAWEATLL